MSAEMKVFSDLIEQKLLNLHTGIVAKIISINGNFANIQPLSMVKQYGKDAVNQAVVSNVPISHNARFKLKWITHNDITASNNASITFTGKIDGPTTQQNHIALQTAAVQHLSAEPIAVGDVVFCLCAERNITETKNGNFAVPPLGHHEMKDAIIISVLD